MRWLALFLGVLLVILAIAAVLLVHGVLLKRSGEDVLDGITTSAARPAVTAGRAVVAASRPAVVAASRPAVVAASRPAVVAAGSVVCPIHNVAAA